MSSRLTLLHSLVGPLSWQEDCLRKVVILQADCSTVRALLWQANSSFFYLLLLLLLLLHKVGADDSPTDLLELNPFTVSVGSYLPPLGSTNNRALASPNGMFNLRIQTWRDFPAFYCMAGVTNEKVNPGSMLWGANNARPLTVTSTCRLFLSPQGDLLLQYDGNKTAWQTHTAGMGVSNLTLHNSGNLVLHTKQGRVVWQSFTQSPAFAWNSGMNLTSNITIFSSAPIVDGVTEFNVPGKFALQLYNHSTMVLFTNSNDSSSRFVYWSSSFTNPSLINQSANTKQVSYVALGDDGFTFYDNSSQALGSIAPTLPSPSSSSSAIRVAIVDPALANLQAYYRADHSWVMFYNSSISACANPIRCGSFSLCNASTGACTCPPRFMRNSAGDCEPETAISFPPQSKSSATADEAISYRFVSVNISFPPQLSAIPVDSVKSCTSLCEDSHVCKVALFDPGTNLCSLFSNLPTLPSMADSKQLMLLKIVEEEQSSRKHLAPILGAVCAAMAVSLCLVCTAAAIGRKRKRDANSKAAAKEEAFPQALPVDVWRGGSEC